MGTLIGLGLGLGLALIAWARIEPVRPPKRPARKSRLAQMLSAAGIVRLTAGRLVALCAALGAGCAVISLGLTGVPAIGVIVGLAAAAAPVVVIQGRVSRRLREHAELWPDAVDNLASAIRAGMSLPESLMQLGERGPDTLRPAFVRFSHDYRATGRFDDSLDLLKARLADPVGDRVIEGLRIAREVGGGDVGRMLRSLSAFLRDDLRTRGELESRQSWTINGARLAVAAPWLVLMAMSLQRDVVGRFASADGALVLGGGAVTCVTAYRLMLRIGRLPIEPRILA
ncbi:MAG TPA: type II secretion system F family protein [Aeromicrobium sp.]|nr:type II secretion system F family protein [Aeromicrobium sp.]HKY57047.1 type II secretion system F family protein [Aeromicrobium sp.]